MKVTAETKIIMEMTRAFRSFRSFISSQAGRGRCRLAGSIRAMNSSYRPMAAMISVAPIRNRSISVRNRRRFWASERDDQRCPPPSAPRTTTP